MNIGEFLPILSLIWLHLVLAEKRALNEYIKHYEELNYDTEELHKSHIRARRSVRDPYLHLKFSAHGRYFNLRLRRDTSTFVSDFKDVDTSHIYQGSIWNEPGSYVHGSVINGTFAGRVHSLKSIFFVERADVYFEKPKFHSVIYHENDVIDDPHKHKKEHHGGGCGSQNAQIREWMEEVQNSAVEPEEPVVQRLKRAVDGDVDRSEPHNIYSASSNGGRERRAFGQDKTTCTLFLQSDTMLWNRMTKPRTEYGLGYTPERAREEITSLFATHVSGIKKIYEDTIFKSRDGSISYKGISFVVRRIKINETAHCVKGENNPFCKPNIDVSNFLNINSLSNHNDFCLAYVFTYRDFTGGTLGLAWVGSPSRASGGICEKYKAYQENKNSVRKSLNTGIVTLINYNSPVPPKVSTLTFAHEVGHNFGSPHDSGTKCTPFSATPPDPKGNYIMYASATSGDRRNNNKFSPCSIQNITLVLDAVFNERHHKHNCFKEPEAAFCGNNIVETDGAVVEECDCGYLEDCNDQCCYGHGHPNECQLKKDKECSPSQGPCCDANCQKIPEDASFECSAASDCNEASYCNGRDAQCPSPDPKNNMTACNKFTQICLDGECRGSICERIGWDQCFLGEKTFLDEKNFDKGKLCFVACANPDLERSVRACVSTGDQDALEDPKNLKLKQLLALVKKDSIKLPPGAPCNNFRGYCDVFQKCRDVDANGPLSRLKKLLFNEQTFNEIRDWIIKHWWAVLLMGMGLIVFMGIFIQLCAVHTPSSNPKMRPARKLTLSRQRQQGPPQPYVAGPSRGGPPHGKGRGPGAARAAQYEMRPHKV